MLTGHPADPSAERVPDHAHVVGRAVERGEAVLDRPVDDVHPDRPGSDAGDARPGVDLDSCHARRVHEQCPVEGSAGAVPGSLDGDT